jgi:hypothetical protein
MKKLNLIGSVTLVMGMMVSLWGSSIESIKNTGITFSIDTEKIVPKVKPVIVKKKVVGKEVSQDVKYKFNQVKDELWRFRTDTIWLRNDIQRLERDARNIASGQNNPWFSHDLRNMAYKMSRYYNDIRRIDDEVRDLINIAEKDKELNSIARDIEWYASDIENNFGFYVENAARDLEYTVRGIDPKLIGYDAQWNAYDISRYARDISNIARNLHWDSWDLVNKTNP